ncbi:MAG: response regulator [Robiginitomaculum sp.]
MATILYAEDDDSMRGFFEKAIEKAGHHVIACADGEGALRALKFADGAFDMLLTDIMMPGLDGVELAKQAETLSPGIKIMFITGFAAVAKQDPNTSPDTKVLSKPVHLRQLVNEIDKLIAA